MLKDYMAKGHWAGGVVTDDPDAPPLGEPFEFDKWVIKDCREVG